MDFVQELGTDNQRWMSLGEHIVHRKLHPQIIVFPSRQLECKIAMPFVFGVRYSVCLELCIMYSARVSGIDESLAYLLTHPPSCQNITRWAPLFTVWHRIRRRGRGSAYLCSCWSILSLSGPRACIVWSSFLGRICETNYATYSYRSQQRCSDKDTVVDDVAFPIHPSTAVWLPIVHAGSSAQYDCCCREADPR